MVPRSAPIRTVRMDGLSLEKVSHAFGDLLVVDDLSLSVAAGEILCLLGPSGCGKTTSLRIAAGLERIQAGRVVIAGREVARPGKDVAAEQRGVGMVFQAYALFPHLSVRDNVAFGLRGPAAEKRRSVDELLERLDIASHGDRFPHLLSGGEQQRVALARALAPRPAVMLMDEPFANLDVRLRDRIRDDTLNLLRQGSAATLMVTHDPDEAMRMADRIAIMRRGRIEQMGTPDDLYRHPANKLIAEFLSETNILHGKVNEKGEVETALGPLAANGLESGLEVDIVLRPEALVMDGEKGGLAATVHTVRPLAGWTVVDLRLPANGTALRARCTCETPPSPGDTVRIHPDPAGTFVFPRDRH